MKSGNSSLRAFTLVELLIVIAIIAVLAAIQLPALASTKSNVRRVHCSDNLKRVGLAFRTWAANHQDRMPMQVGFANGGASSAVGVDGGGATFAANYPPATGPRGVFGMFVVMSNELNTPKILACPSDWITPATIFGPNPTTGSGTGFFQDQGASYFVGVDANDTSPSMFLTGDYNLGTGVNQAIAPASKFMSAGTNANWLATSIGWRDTLHSRQGNVGLADGSVQGYSTFALRVALNNSGSPRSTFVGPGGAAFTLAPGSASASVGHNRLQLPKIN